MSSRDRAPPPSGEQAAELRKRVAADPYAAAAWEQLVSEADRRGPQRAAELSAVYEELLLKFPTAVRAARACPGAGLGRRPLAAAN